MKRDFLSIDTYTPEKFMEIVQRAIDFKTGKVEYGNLAKGKSLAMIFEKQSLRTRMTFEIGIAKLGGHAVYLQPSDIGLGTREPVKDVARNITRWCDIIMARVFLNSTIVELAQYANIPVVNALCDIEHPCQAMADFQTIYEHKGRFKGLKLAFLGDGNNVAHSLMLSCAKMGMDFAIGCPEDYEPMLGITKRALEIAETSGAKIEIENDPIKAIKDADIVYTDVWTSMGQELENEKRLKAFPPYQVNSELMKHAKDDAIVLHCLPAKRGLEITDEVIESPNSVVFDEAENRLWAQMAVMADLLS